MASTSKEEDSPAEICPFLTLPTEVLRHILTFFKYEEISDLRSICKTIDQTCQELLNQGYHKVERYHSQYQKDLKSRLPRRESERRNHPLARHCDIMAAIETRLSLLGMTFMKYVDMKLCCFIPGKVLDEILHLIDYIKKTPKPPRAHELLQELRDISSMAMEYFDEKIVPTLRKKISHTSQFVMKSPCTATSSGIPMAATSMVARRQDLMRFQTSVNNLLVFKKEFLDYKRQLVDQKKKTLDQEKRIQKQDQLIADLNSKILDQDKKLNEMTRKFTEYDHKFEGLTAEISKLNQVSGTEKSVAPRSSRKRKTLDEDDDDKGDSKPSTSARIARSREKKMKHSSN
ncbi:uncharacterized protein LOC144449899 [Glandiceps talaboti]